jgi:hypothetical protein
LERDERLDRVNEAFGILHDVVDGKIRLIPIFETWDERYVGNVAFKTDNSGESHLRWIFVFFNDCDSLDYVDMVISPYGWTVDYLDTEYAVSKTISNDLSVTDWSELEKKLKQAKRITDLIAEEIDKLHIETFGYNTDWIDKFDALAIIEKYGGLRPFTK